MNLLEKRLRNFAKGKPCQLRIQGCCNHDPATTVLAHIRRGGVAGMGQKPPALCGVHACSSCHDRIDGRTHVPGMLRSELDALILDGLCRTLAEVWREIA